MLNIHSAIQAKKAARSLEKALKLRGVTLSHGAALDVLASLAGHNSWNNLSATFSEAHINEKLHSFEIAHLQDCGPDLDYGEESVVVAQNGFQLRTSGPNEAGTDYVRVCDSLGRELNYWTSSEWAEAPEEVMGAIVGALTRNGLGQSSPTGGRGNRKSSQQSSYKLFEIRPLPDGAILLSAGKSEADAISGARARKQIAEGCTFEIKELDAANEGAYLVGANAGFYGEFASLAEAARVAEGLLQADDSLDATTVQTLHGEVILEFIA